MRKDASSAQAGQRGICHGTLFSVTPPKNLSHLLNRLGRAAPGDTRVTVEAMIDVIGRRSFGPLILIAGLVTVSPIGDIPSVPTMVAIIVILISSQLIWGRSSFWLPGWLLRRSVSRKRFRKSVSWMKKPARTVDRLLGPRLGMFVHGVAIRVIAAVCLLIALAMPVMEFVPFTATGAGVALTAFGLALISDDGLMALVALIFTFGTAGAIAWYLL